MGKIVLRAENFLFVWKREGKNIGREWGRGSGIITENRRGDSKIKSGGKCGGPTL